MANIVITMGGMGSRFIKAGYNLPKYQIEVKKKTLFEWSLLSLQKWINNKNNFIFIVKREDDAVKFIEEKCDKLNIYNSKVVEIDALTDGQATTVLFAAPFVKENEPLIVYNIDTHIHPDELNPNDFKYDGWIPCFDAPGEGWSFVRLNEESKVVEVREKVRISNYATVGLYGFGSYSLYEKVYKEYYSHKDNIEKGEKYIAPLYNKLVEDGKEITISNIPFEKVQPIGTPNELEQFKTNSYTLI